MKPDHTQSSLIISRVDRIGDLILSLPTIAYLKKHGFAEVVLHCSAYTRDIATWALENGICDKIWIQGEKAPPFRGPMAPHFLSLFYDKTALADLRALEFIYQKKGEKIFSMGPRSKLRALFAYTKTLAQHRSQVKKSECLYNVELAKAFLKEFSLAPQDFEGLAPLKIHSKRGGNSESAELILNVCNKGSAANWSIDDYWSYYEKEKAHFESAAFIVSGNEASERLAFLERKQNEMGKNTFQIKTTFNTLRDLIVYIAGAKMVLSSSTGTLHIANALGKDVFAIYPKKKVESFDRWKPDGFWHAGSCRFIEIG